MTVSRVSCQNTKSYSATCMTVSRVSCQMDIAAGAVEAGADAFREAINALKAAASAHALAKRVSTGPPPLTAFFFLFFSSKIIPIVIPI